MLSNEKILQKQKEKKERKKERIIFIAMTMLVYGECKIINTQQITGHEEFEILKLFIKSQNNR